MDLRTKRPGAGGLVGRDSELDDLLTAMARAADGNGRLVLIGGEPGIGKSRLADELAARARDAGYLVLWGRGWEDAGAPPYWPWVQALRSYVRAADPTEVRRNLGTGAVDVAQMLPELGDLFPGLKSRPTAQSDSARFQLFDSTATFLARAAAGRTILLVLDDLQAADVPSILFLQFLASQLNQMALLVVGTYRDVALTPDHPLTTAIAELARERVTRNVLLSGLDAEAVASFIEAATGVVPHHRVAAAIQRETNGNPLFVSEAVRLLTAEGRLSAVAELPTLRIAVPAGVRDVIARRIGHLGDSVEHTLTRGAALGPEFSLEVLRRVAEPDTHDVRDHLEAAVVAGLLVPVIGSPNRYRFSHDLVRETLYDSLPADGRATIHRRIAEVMEELSAGVEDPYLAELAFHYFQAAYGGDGAASHGDDTLTERAMEYVMRAAGQASRSLAFEEAIRLRRMALGLLAQRSTPDDELHTEILLALSDAQARAGDLEGSQASCRQAAALARRTGRANQLARAAIAYGGRLPWTRPGADQFLIPLLQDALVLLGGDDERLRVRLLTRLACAWRSSPEQFEQSDAFSQQAMEIARKLNDASTLSYALAGRYWATWWPDNAESRIGISEEMVAVAEGSGDTERLIDAHLMLYMAYTETARMAQARRAEEEVRRLANELRQPAQLWLGVAPRALLALLEGDFALAETLVAQELNWGDPITNVRDERSAGIMHTYLLRREQGRGAEAEPLLRSAVEEFPWYPLHRAALIQALLDQGRDVEARTAFRALAEGEFAALYRDNEWLLGMSLAAEACARLGDADAARVLYQQLEPFAGRQAVGHAEGSLGAVDRYLGLLAGTVGELDRAVAHMTEAIRINAEIGARPLTAHAQHDMAVLRRRRAAPGDAASADVLDAKAQETARAIGASALEATIREAVPAADSPPSQAVAPGTGTFRREGEYWAISFDGDTVRIRDAKGMRHLAQLLAEPGREFHAVDLTTGGGSPREVPASAHAESLSATKLGDAGPRLDASAKDQYRSRLRDLAEDAREAEEWNDSERASKARAEMEFLAAELSGAMGLGGRDRQTGSAAERARLSVTRAIRSAMGRIAEQNPALGRHLAATIRTGTFCSYQPDPRAPLSWEL